jgi:hypothetical protein
VSGNSRLGSGTTGENYCADCDTERLGQEVTLHNAVTII